jgi:hypothetical protein
MKATDFPQICSVFRNLEEIELEAENYYSCPLDLSSLDKLRKFEVTLNPSETYHSLLAESPGQDSDNILTLTPSQIANFSYKLNADAFVSHDLGYCLDHFGYKEPFRSMPKVLVRVGILMHKVSRADIKKLSHFLPEPNFKQVVVGSQMFQMTKFLKDAYRFGHFPFELKYKKVVGEIKMYAEEFDVQLRI